VASLGGGEEKKREKRKGTDELGTGAFGAQCARPGKKGGEGKRREGKSTGAWAVRFVRPWEGGRKESRKGVGERSTDGRDKQGRSTGKKKRKVQHLHWLSLSPFRSTAEKDKKEKENKKRVARCAVRDNNNNLGLSTIYIISVVSS